MTKRLGRLLISLMVLLSLGINAAAVSIDDMTDIGEHWAKGALTFCMENGLFQGTSATTMEPDGTMTRGMFATVLGRLEGIDPAEYQDWYLGGLYTDVSAQAYYAPYVNWATRYGIVNGKGDGTFAPDEPITREQMATMVMRYASIYNYEIVGSTDVYVDVFTDGDQVSTYAKDAVESLKDTGIINGYPNDNGTYRFAPQNTASRAECATIFYRLSQRLQPYAGRTLIPATGITLADSAQTLHLGDTSPMIAAIAPSDATNQTLTWVSSNSAVASVDRNGKVTALTAGTADIYVYTNNGLSAKCTITVEPNKTLAYDGESYADKCVRVFGEVVSDPRTYYTTQDTSYLVTIPVKVWDFTDSTYTTKYTKTIYLQVHQNLAATVQAIFEEIYNGPEQFPIKSAGGYYTSTMSEHDPGLAIDINPDSNYYCDPSGKAITGSHWDPENDPYSIPLEGDVVKAFQKYGYTRGIYWRSGYKDYMHFSFFAT
jgi:hypothetical protein